MVRVASSPPLSLSPSLHVRRGLFARRTVSVARLIVCVFVAVTRHSPGVSAQSRPAGQPSWPVLAGRRAVLRRRSVRGGSGYRTVTESGGILAVGLSPGPVLCAVRYCRRILAWFLSTLVSAAAGSVIWLWPLAVRLVDCGCKMTLAVDAP